MEELIVDVKDIKKGQSFAASLCIEGSSSSSSSNDICKKQTTILNLNNSSQQTQAATTANHHPNALQVQSAQANIISIAQMNHHAATANQDSLSQIQNVDMEPNMQAFRNSSNFIDTNVNVNVNNPFSFLCFDHGY